MAHTQAIVEIQSLSPYSQSRPMMPGEDPKRRNETHDEYEKRTWQSRIHANDDGDVVIPASAFKNGLMSAAKFLGMKIPGEGMKKYGARFEAGVMVLEDVPIGVKLEDVGSEWLFVNSDGRRGGGSRVWKCFPIIKGWRASVVIDVLDEKITEAVFREHIETAGMFVGLGRWRPEKGGTNGRFIIKSIKWNKIG